MSAFGGLILTNRGRNLQAKAQAGTTLNFTRIAIGDGQLGGSSILELTALKNQKMSLNINKLKILTGGKAVVGAVLSNQGLASGFYWRELGLFAQDPDLGEILYCYGNSGVNAEYIPAGGGPDIVEKNIDIVSIIGNASSVTATIDQSLVYATQEDINTAISTITPSLIGAETPAGAQAKANGALAAANTYTDQAIVVLADAHAAHSADNLQQFTEINNKLITGNDGKKYKTVACALRNNAGTWEIFEDENHKSVNVASVSQTVDDIRIDYNFTASKVGSLICAPDETYVKDGLNFGASVGTTFSLIRPTINKNIGGYISYNGSSWVISNAPGVLSAVWSTDKLIITHENMYQLLPNIYNVQVTHRDGIYIAQLGSVGTTTFEVKFYDFSGSLITSPNTNMKFYFNKTAHGAVRTQDILQPSSNIWIFGIFEV